MTSISEFDRGFIHGYNEAKRESPVEKARARVVEAAKAWAQPWLNPDAARIAMPMQTDALVSAVAELERLEAEAQP